MGKLYLGMGETLRLKQGNVHVSLNHCYNHCEKRHCNPQFTNLVRSDNLQVIKLKVVEVEFKTQSHQFQNPCPLPH